MRKSLKRVLARLRAATNGTFRKGLSARAGLQEPHRLQTVPATVRARS